MIAGLTTHTNLYIEKTLQRYKMYLYQLIARPFQEIIASRLDSDLEAFSHNPTDDSIATIAAQLIAFTMYLNEVFLSY